VAGLCRLCTELNQNKDKSVTEFIDRFDDQWNRVYQIMSGPASNASYKKYLQLFLEQDYAKRDSPLATLSYAYPNPVDNLTTKPNLSYEELRCYMRELASNNQLNTVPNNQLNTSPN